MIVVFTGLPGSGKSLKLARTLIEVLYRNKFFYQKQVKRYAKENGLDPKTFIDTEGLIPKRVLYTNLKFSKEVEDEFPGFIKYWTDLRELTSLRDVDVAIDEIATYFDARLWETLSLEMRRWLAQHRKFGIEIYGTSQDFAQCDKAFRRLTSGLLYLRKWIGSADISPTRPNPKYIWGLVMVTELDPTTYDEQKSKFKTDSIIPTFMFITRKHTAIFDTRAEVKLSKALPMKHIDRVCELPNCPHTKTQHV